VGLQSIITTRIVHRTHTWMRSSICWLKPMVLWRMIWLSQSGGLPQWNWQINRKDYLKCRTKSVNSTVVVHHFAKAIPGWSIAVMVL